MYIIFYKDILDDREKMVIKKNKIYKIISYVGEYVKIIGEDETPIGIDLASNQNAWCFYKGNKEVKK